MEGQAKLQPPLSSEEAAEMTGQMNGGDFEEVEEVMSEVHLGCPPASPGPYISRFTLCIPPDVEVESSRFSELFKDGSGPEPEPQLIILDEDGDLVVTRRRDPYTHSCTVSIQHNITSSIPSVGLQVWKAELLLSDFVLHKMCTSSEFDGVVSLELGAGTVSKLLTDHGEEILDNCAKNVYLNSGVFNNQAAVHVRELDWMNPWPPEVKSRYSWTPLEVEEANGASLLLAADVIYSDDLTDALLCVLEKLMSLGSEKVLYLALEKRYNFSLNDLDVVANGYSHFRRYLRDEQECEGLEYGSLPYFVGKRLDSTQIPQYIREYDRGNDVEIWQIKYDKRTA